MKKSVLVIGLDPALLDFSSPELAPMNLTSEKVEAGIRAEIAQLEALGYESARLWVDLGDTAEAVLSEHLTKNRYDCIVIGAGIRVNPKFFLLFERLLNVVHALAPTARIAFNTRPGDTVAPAQRWV